MVALAKQLGARQIVEPDQILTRVLEIQPPGDVARKNDRILGIDDGAPIFFQLLPLFTEIASGLPPAVR